MIHSEEFIKAVVLAQNPEVSLAENDPIYDIQIRFFGKTVLPALLQLDEEARASRSVSNINMPPTAFDGLLANYFFKRFPGTRYIVGVTINFLNNKEVFNIRRSDSFIASGSVFNPSTDRVITPADYIPFSIDGETRYYIDIPLIAANLGSENSAGIGDDVITPYTLSNYDSSKVTSISNFGTDAEDNAAALARLQEEISIEMPISDRAIKTILSKAFPGAIQDVITVGMLEPEMYRDALVTGVPSTKARLYFSEKIDLFLKIRFDDNTYQTVFRYGTPTGSRYIINDIVDISIQANSSLWKQHASGNFYVEVPIGLLDISNPEGFSQDTPIHPRVFLTPVTSVGLDEIYPSFLGASAHSGVYEDIGTTILHIGSLTDIYVRTSITRQTITKFVKIEDGGVIDLKAYAPVLKIHSIKKKSDNTDVDFFSLLIDEPTLRFSAQDTTMLYVDPSLIGTEILIDMSYAPLVQAIDQYINNRSMKELNSHTIVRFFFPLFISTYAEVAVRSNSANNTVSDLGLSEANYINSLPIDAPLVASGITSVLHQSNPSLVQINTLNVYGEQHNPDGTVINFFDESVIRPVERLDMGVSVRTCCFIYENSEFVFV